MKKLVSFLAVLFVHDPVFAVSGADLVNYYESDTGSFNRGVFGGYVVAVSDTWDDVPNPRTGTCFSIPENASNGQIQEVAIKWLRSRPETWHFSGDSLVQAAFDDSFPCK